MDLIQLLIEMIVKAFEPPRPRTPTTGGQSDLTRQIQARIEAARLQDTQSQRLSASAPMRAQLPPPGRLQASAPFKKKGKRKAPPALPAKVVSPPPPDAAAPALIAPPAPKPVAVNVNAQVLARWLKPQTLRAQFILTEVFQPPIALRESHLS